jgi:hypothetical protein
MSAPFPDRPTLVARGRAFCAARAADLGEALFQVALTAWVGGVWTVGYLVVPTLFASLEDRRLAGQLAGRMFEVGGWTGLALGALVLAGLLVRHRRASVRRLAPWLALMMLILTAVGLFGIQPLMAHMKAAALPRDVMVSPWRDRFIAWHGIASLLYLLQSVCGLGLLLRAGRPTR